MTNSATTPRTAPAVTDLRTHFERVKDESFDRIYAAMQPHLPGLLTPRADLIARAKSERGGNMVAVLAANLTAPAYARACEGYGCFLEMRDAYVRSPARPKVDDHAGAMAYAFLENRAKAGVDVYTLDARAADPVTVGWMGAYFTEACLQSGFNTEAERTTVQNTISTEMSVMLEMLLFRRAGHHVYRCSPGLAQRFLCTELSGLVGTDVRLPYPSIYVEVPTSLGLEAVATGTGAHVVTGAYLSEVHTLDGERHLSVMLTCAPNEKSHNCVDDAVEYFNVTLNERPVVEVLDSLVQKLTARFNANDEQGVQGALMLSGDDRHIMPAVRPSLSMWRSAVSWLLNVAFYATHPDAEKATVELNAEGRALRERANKAPMKSQKRRELFDRLKGVDMRERILLGGSVTVNRGMPTSERDYALARKRGDVAVRSLVAGHYRRFAHGVGRTERRWQYVEPYWRGPDGAPVASPTHVLSEGQSA